jgi:hypothetical protein
MQRQKRESNPSLQIMSLALYQLSYFAVVFLTFYRGRAAEGMLAFA